MQEYLFIVYYLCLLLALVLGLKFFSYLDKPMKTLVASLSITAVSELIAYILLKLEYYTLRPLVYHISVAIVVVIISQFYIELISPFRKKLLTILSTLIWSILALLNILFLQSFDNINSNYFVLVSFSVITMSLYSIYWMIKNDFHDQLFKSPHFWISIIWLTFWSSSFFYWASIKILYGRHWEYITIVDTLQITLNVITYAAFAAVFYFYPKKRIAHEHS